jgi:2-polyprenyl-3-methyl-5-hydroxy-6-metoxy-1,4-benzoquinol methylase
MSEGCQSSIRRKEYNVDMWLVLFLMTRYSVKGLITALIFIMAEFAIKQLNLEPGMWVIDIGCGCGDWLDYLHSKGMNVVGINITGVQVEVCRSRGLDVVWINWKDIVR